MEVVNLVAEEARRALPMMPVRVLLAEADDSTRHVISALLRKCGYHGAHNSNSNGAQYEFRFGGSAGVIVLVLLSSG